MVTELFPIYNNIQGYKFDYNPSPRIITVLYEEEKEYSVNILIKV